MQYFYIYSVRPRARAVSNLRANDFYLFGGCVILRTTNKLKGVLKMNRFVRNLYFMRVGVIFVLLRFFKKLIEKIFGCFLYFYIFI